ncbi:hypothetical protein [Niastella populi]|uniref:Fibronectin type-III domain-containing protein n=1 Tax=Niastella populi TaxID=550983 RepID=A0A1V9GCL2_9BACT|nr:hypothetical protein [Niastella populi]OQP68353.1 hypothetical protein A4R26_00655 [Niastella populi]
MILKIKKSYKKPSDTYMLKLTGRILESMKNNPYFPNPMPTLPDVEKAFGEFQVSLNVAGRNDRTLSSAKNDKKAVLSGLLEKLGDHVTLTCNGDKTMLLSSGFDITGIGGASQDLTPVEQLDVEIGPPGQAIARVKRVTGARMYTFQCTPDPVTTDSVWASDTTSDPQNTFTNLNSIARYWFRVIAHGRGKQSVASVLVSRVIQ